jgi:polygalacturonase
VRYFIVGPAIISICLSWFAVAEETQSTKTAAVNDFGAAGNGVQDDAAAIQKALDSGAAVVTIPPGLYRIGQTLASLHLIAGMCKLTLKWKRTS